MKKQIAAALAAMFVMSSAAAVMAAPVADDSLKINGEMRVRDTHDTGIDNGTDYRLRLTLTKAINENLTFKTRFTQNKDINAAAATTSNDILSLTYKFEGGSTVLVGKDDAWLGAGLLMDTQVEGLQFATQLGDVKVNGLGGRNNNKDFAGISAQTKSDALSFGATYFENDSAVKNFAVNAGYDFGKVKLAGEYTENTEADDDNTAINVVATLGAVKNVGDASLAVGFVSLELNSGLGAYTTLFTPAASDWEGITVKGQYMAAKGVTFTAEQSIGETVSTKADLNRTRVYMQAKF
jgi:hypothetical protein